MPFQRRSFHEWLPIARTLRLRGGWARSRAWGLLLFGLAAVLASRAAAPPDPDAFADAVRAARLVTRVGPGSVPLLDQAELDLPLGVDFIPQPQAGAMLAALGQEAGVNLVGLVQAHAQGQWLVAVRFDPIGQVRVDAEHDWDTDRLLARIRAAVVQRSAEGAPHMNVLGWAQRPAFDAARHRLVWSVRLRPDGTAQAVDERVNYNTHALGRTGVLSLNLVSPASTIRSDKRLAHVLLGAASFLPGQAYADFVEGRDSVSPKSMDDFIALESMPSVAVLPDPDASSPWLLGALGGLAAVLAGVLWWLLGQRRPQA